MVPPSSAAREQQRQLSVDARTTLEVRKDLLHSLLSLNLLEFDEVRARHNANETTAVQGHAVDDTKEQSKVSTKQAQGGKYRVEQKGSCSTILEGREDGVAEFKGPIYGLVRFAQANEQLEARMEATFDGLTPGLHSWSVNEYGDLREGAASTGLPYAPSYTLAPMDSEEEAVGMLGTLTADSSGHAEYTRNCPSLAVWDLIGRSVVLYRSSKLQANNAIAAAVIARCSMSRAERGAQKLCTCDGTVVWQSG